MANYNDFTKKIIKKFESVNDFSNFIKNTPKTNSGIKYGASEREENPERISKFYYTENFEQANKLLLSGDFETAKKITNINNLKDTVNGQGTIKKNVLKYNNVGFLPIVPKVLAGQPQNMLTIKRENTSTSKVLNICYNCSVPYYIKPEDMIKTAANVASVIKQLENNGYRVNLYVCSCAYSGKTFATIITKLKAAGEYLDTLRLAYPFINPSFLRRHIFACQERLKGFTTLKCQSMVPYDYTAKDAIKDAFGQTNIKILSYKLCENKTVEQIIKFIK